MTPGRAVLTALVALVALAAPARADDLRAAMEADNARWLAAFNTPDPTVRVFERQGDGTWLTRVHIYNSHARPGS
jgi:hypothetical protein